MKVYYHEISKEELEDGKKLSVQQFLKKYSQPDWCDYPDALVPTLGCWSLVYFRESISENFCSNCECFNKNK